MPHEIGIAIRRSLRWSRTQAFRSFGQVNEGWYEGSPLDRIRLRRWLRITSHEGRVRSLARAVGERTGTFIGRRPGRPSRGDGRA